MSPIIGAVLGTVVNSIADWWKRREETRAMEHQTTMEIKKAEAESVIRRLETQQQLDAEWEIEQIKQSGWKDEWVTILVSVPLVMCFIPGLVPYVKDGFAALETMPAWYQYSVLAVFAAALGFRKLTDFVSAIKGK